MSVHSTSTCRYVLCAYDPIPKYIVKWRICKVNCHFISNRTFYCLIRSENKIIKLITLTYKMDVHQIALLIYI